MPAYPPAGHGDHLFVRFEKRNLTTREAIARIARALHADVRAVGVAGQKDKRAVTTQWASFERAAPEAALGLSLPDIRVLEASRHPHKLRTGHLRGNRFALAIRQASDVSAAREVLAELERVGIPNYYGEQRFGVDDRNVARAYAMLRGEAPAPRDRFERKLLMSALQSALFNRWLSERIADGLFARPILGDLLRKEDTGGLFVNTDDAAALARMQAWEVSPTGPMFGASMRQPEGPAAVREQAVFASSGLSQELLAQHRTAGEGTRRPARVRLANCQIDAERDTIFLRFELPSGAYGTTLLREVMKPADS